MVVVETPLTLHPDQFRERRSTRHAVIHCSATHPGQDIGAKDIHAWHLNRGWVAIGYHYVIRRDGRVEAGRPPQTVGAHVEGFNAASIGICMVGGVDIKGAESLNFTTEQWQSLETVCLRLKELYPGIAFVGHRDFPNVQKFCPSFDVRTWAKQRGISH